MLNNICLPLVTFNECNSVWQPGTKSIDAKNVAMAFGRGGNGAPQSVLFDKPSESLSSPESLSLRFAMAKIGAVTAVKVQDRIVADCGR